MNVYQPAGALVQFDEFVRRVRWYITLRWVYISLLTLISTLALVIVQGFSHETILNLATGLGALFYNGIFWGMAHLRVRSRVYYLAVALVEISADIALATYLIVNRGGINGRSIILYAIPIIVAGALFGRFATFFSASLCAALYGLVLIRIANGSIVATNVSLASDPTSAAYVGYSIAFYAAVFFVLALVSDFLLGLNRQREQVKARTELVALASHELRTPATAARGLIEMVQAEAKKLSPEGRHYLEQAYIENDRELALIENLLAVARLDAGEYEPPSSPSDLSQLAQQAIDHLKPVLAAKGQTVAAKFAKAAVVVVDTELIELAISNLIMNANRFAPADAEIIISTETTTDTVTLSVKDQGPGIAGSDQAAIFERFSGARRSLGGAGLGLYLVRQIATIHGGTIGVVSAPGQGSEFSLQLPRKRK